MRRFLAAVLIVLALVLPGVAVADPAPLDNPDNLVNTTQMPDSSFLYDTDIYDLVNADSSLDGKTVRVTGEVIGDALIDSHGGRGVWIALSSLDESKEATVTVLIDQSALDLIDGYGSYARVGTTLQVQGTFHLACSTHEGLSDIHATSVRAVAASVETPDEFDAGAFLPGAVLVAAGLLLTLVYRMLRERQR